MKLYPNSLVGRYFKSTSNFGDIQTLANVVVTHPTTLRPAKDVVIHLRLGDVLEWCQYSVDEHLESPLPYTKNPGSHEVYVKPYSFFDSKLNNMKDIKHIDLVYGSHYPIPLPKSKDYMKKLQTYFLTKGISTTVKEPATHADQDFIYLCIAPRLIVTGGGFSDLANQVNIALKSNHKPIIKQNAVFTLIQRSDLLGAWFQQILTVYALSVMYNIPLVVSSASANYEHFFVQEKGLTLDFGDIGRDSEKQHTEYRKWALSKLQLQPKNLDGYTKEKITPGIGFVRHSKIAYEFPENTRYLQDVVVPPLAGSINNLFNANFQNMIRQKLFDTTKLPNKFQMNYIAIHFRAGEICHMKERYLHSTQYSSVLQTLKQYNLPIYVFTTKPCTNDDMHAFTSNQCEIVTDKIDGLTTWTIFMNATVFVMGKSSFSYVPGLLRPAPLKTFYTPFWHTKLNSWTTWYPDKI